MPQNPDGLSDIYKLKSGMAYWQVGTISGYPAVKADSSSTPGSCVYNVGVNDHLAFFAGTAAQDTTEQACAFAKQAAEDVIANLKAQQGGS